MPARFRSLSDRLVVSSSKALSVLSRQLEGEDATCLELDMRQIPTMWANARKQRREDAEAANLAAAKNGHLTENDSSGDAMMESMIMVPTEQLQLQKCTRRRSVKRLSYW